MDSLALLLFGEGDVEVEVELAAGRGRPGKCPSHPPLVGLQLRKRRTRHRRERDVMVRQMNDKSVEAIGDRRTGRTPRRVVGPEHEVVDEQLRASGEQIRQRGRARIGLEPVLLVDPHPRQRLTPPRHLVAATGQLLLRLEQFEPRFQPLLACSGHVFRHHCSPLGSLVERPGPTASTVTTAPAHSTMAVRNVGERIVQSTMMAFSPRRTGLSSCDRLGPRYRTVRVTSVTGFRWTR